MADLYNLLGELEEETQDFNAGLIGDDDDKPAVGRPSVETAATEPMTPPSPLGEDWDSPSALPRRHIAVPVALQEAKRRRDEGGYGDADEYEYDNELYSDLLKDETEKASTTLVDQGQINELYTQLHHFWHQEKHCPELLEYNSEMVEQVKGQIEARQEWIDQLLQDTTTTAAEGELDAGQASVHNLLATLAQIDLDRVKYVLANWLAQRLSKIEAHPLHMRERVDHMSDAELAYLKEYGSLLEDHLRHTVLDHIPEAWQGLDEAHMIDQPDYDGYHFWMVVDEEPIEIDGVEQPEGSCLVAKYSVMRDFMRNGKVELQL